METAAALPLAEQTRRPAQSPKRPGERIITDPTGKRRKQTHVVWDDS